MMDCRALHLTAVATAMRNRDRFRWTEIDDKDSHECLTGNLNPIVHTARAAFDPTAHQAAHNEDCMSLRPAPQGGR
jgi:hypothetical protein